MDLERLGGLDHPLDHYGGRLDSTLGHLVAPQSYDGLTIVLEIVFELVNSGNITSRGREKVVVECIQG